MQIVEKDIKDLIPYEWNNKIHDETQINRLANSIKEFGFKNPILIDKNNIIVSGHGRLEGAKKLGLKKVPCIVADDLTEEQIKKFRILDNKLNESDRDLANLKSEIDSLPDFNMGDLKLSTADLFPEFEAPEFDPDEYGDSFSLPDGEKPPFGQMTFVFADEQKEMIEEAIELVKKTDLYKSQMNYGNENSNGNALSCIVEQWLMSNK